tara:strand:- start:262 stop:1242 length:981 start_codon:yes stop_codon:yes gene_type:complete
MIRTRQLVSDLTDVPDTWVFEYYLNLGEKLNGQDFRMHSVFNSKDNDPSMFIYYKDGKYKFKDFSSGNQGDCLSLVKALFNLNFGEAALKVINDYNSYLLNNKSYKISEFKIRNKFQVASSVNRQWTNFDKQYWNKYKIGSKLLDSYNVKPIASFVLQKDDDYFVIEGLRMYGYYKNNGDLYKIYQPLSDKRFFKVKDYIQGIEQLTYDKPYLVICSSLKDVMAFRKLDFKNAEVIAPDSENTMIPEKTFTDLTSKYKAVCTLFDNDEAGIKAMLKYKEKYNISLAHLKLEKDLSDSIESHGIDTTREHLYPILTKALTGTIKHLP